VANHCRNRKERDIRVRDDDWRAYLVSEVAQSRAKDQRHVRRETAIRGNSSRRFGSALRHGRRNDHATDGTVGPRG
jgi:hypothetical protein